MDSMESTGSYEGFAFVCLAGMTARLVKVVPACAIMLSSYEYGKIYFKNYNNEQKRLNTSALASQPK